MIPGSAIAQVPMKPTKFRSPCRSPHGNGPVPDPIPGHNRRSTKPKVTGSNPVGRVSLDPTQGAGFRTIKRDTTGSSDQRSTDRKTADDRSRPPVSESFVPPPFPRDGKTGLADPACSECGGPLNQDGTCLDCGVSL